MTHAAVATTATDDSSTNPLTKLKDEEPVLTLAAVLWVLGQVGTILVGHHILGTQQWTSMTNTLAPILVTVVLGVGAWLTRSVVDSPKTAKEKDAVISDLKSAAATTGILNDADFARLAYLVEDHAQNVAQHIIGSSSYVAAKSDTASASSGGTATVTPTPTVTTTPANPTPTATINGGLTVGEATGTEPLPTAPSTTPLVTGTAAPEQTTP